MGFVLKVAYDQMSTQQASATKKKSGKVSQFSYITFKGELWDF